MESRTYYMHRMTSQPSSQTKSGTPVRANTQSNGSTSGASSSSHSTTAGSTSQITQTPSPVSSPPQANPPSSSSSVSYSSSATTLPAAKSVSTSTITDHPFSTFSTPVSITLTNSDGETATSAPPFITSIASSTNSDGSSVVYTHVIANPTGSFSSNAAVGQS